MSYDNKFFDNRDSAALESARRIVPIVLKLVKINSVIDIGCGRGAWLKAFQENGVAAIQGIDGTYIDPSKLFITPNCFTPIDLNQPFEIKGRYDLAVCLEVAEHLSARNASLLIRNLTAIAPLVLFSAAIPGQGGHYHENEQWPFYWENVFTDYGFQKVDPIRPYIWQDNHIEWWYRQNIFLYASPKTIAESSILCEEKKRTDSKCLELIHRDILSRYTSLSGVLSELPSLFLRFVKHRLGHRFLSERKTGKN